MTQYNRKSQLRAWQNKINLQFEKCINTLDSKTPTEKRAQTLAYNGMRHNLRKLLHYIFPFRG